MVVEKDLRTELLEQVQNADWAAIRPHLARDAVILVAPELDFLDTAVAVARDDKTLVQAWIAQAQLAKPSREQLAVWEKTPEMPFRFVIVAPFVLIQRVLN